MRAWWCTNGSLVKCCALRVHVTHPYGRLQCLGHLGLQNADFQTTWGRLDIVQLRVEPFEACPHETNASFDFEREVSVFEDNSAEVRRRRAGLSVCIYLWPAASMASGETVVGWSRARRSIVCVFFSETVRPAASKTVTITVFMLGSPPAGFETIPASSAYNMPHTYSVRTHVNGTSFPTTNILLEVDQIPHDVFVLPEAYYSRTACIAGAKNM